MGLSPPMLFELHFMTWIALVVGWGLLAGWLFEYFGRGGRKR